MVVRQEGGGEGGEKGEKDDPGSGTEKGRTLRVLRLCALAAGPFFRKSQITVSIHAMILKSLLFQYCFVD